MTVASADRTSLRYNIEVDNGVTPDVKMKELRFTGESLSLQLSSTESQEINDARQIIDLVQTGSECGGSINLELSAGTYDDFMLALIGAADWTNVINISANSTIAFTAGTSISDLDEISGTGLFGGVAPGQWLLVSGATNAKNNGMKKVKTVAAGLLTLETFGSLADEVAGASISIKGKMLRNPSTGAAFVKKSFSFERYHSDVGKFFIFKGMRANTLNLNFATQSIITGSIDFMGQSSEVDDATFVPNNVGGVNAATTTKVLNAITDVKNENIIIDGEVADESYIQSLSLSITNNLRGVKAIGYKGNAEITEGRLAVTGNLSIYFNSVEYYNKYINSSEFGIAYSVVNEETGRGYAFTLPRVKISSDQPNASGTGQDVLENMAIQALMAPGGYSIQIDAF